MVFNEVGHIKKLESKDLSALLIDPIIGWAFIRIMGRFWHSRAKTSYNLAKALEGLGSHALTRYHALFGETRSILPEKILVFLDMVGEYRSQLKGRIKIELLKKPNRVQLREAKLFLEVILLLLIIIIFVEF